MKKLASMVLAASAAFASSQLFALAPTVTPELTVTLSGASAQDVGLLKIIEGLCTAGTIDYFSESGSPSIANFNGYFCSVANTKLSLPAGVTALGNLGARDTNSNGSVDVLVLKRSAGGSGEGPNGVCGALSVTSQVVVDGTCSDAGSVSPEVAGDKHWKCPSLQQKQSDGGLTDLEFNKFPAPFNSVCDGKTLVTQPIWGTIFNTPVSLNFRNALQCAQGLTVGDETEANMPTLPKSVIASAFNGGIANWDTIRATDANGVYTTLKAAVTSRVAAGQCAGYNVATNPIPTDTRARVCRRVGSSGTNNQFRVKLLNASCNAEAQDQVNDNTPSSTNNTNTNANWQNVAPPVATQAAIIEASSNGNMESCLGAFSDPASPATQRWAIGIVSLENNVALTKNYRFIKIDGVAPTVTNVVANNYNDWVESQWIWINASSGTQDQKDAVDFQEILQKSTGEALAVGGLVTSGFVHSFGASGLVALNTVPGNVPSLPISAANPVATATHAAGGTLSSCRTPQVKVPTTVVKPL
jgi:hypothetical protein